jgi:hypothetical protein
MTDLTGAENDALVEALLWLSHAPQDDRLSDVSFGRYSNRSGCWWTMRLTTEVRNSEVQASPEDDETKYLAVVRAWREGFFPQGGSSE